MAWVGSPPAWSEGPPDRIIGRSFNINYYIFLVDADQIAQLQQQYPYGVTLSPNEASALYGAPIGDLFSPSPKIWIPETSMPLATARHVPANGDFSNQTLNYPYRNGERTFQVSFYSWNANTGGSHELDGNMFDWQWVGLFLFQAPPVPPGPPPDQPLMRRYWHDGFETGCTAGEIAATTFNGSQTLCSRDASRFSGGLGMAYRGNSSTVAGHRYLGPGGTGGFSQVATWERFYLRPRRYPSSEHPFWSVGGSQEGGASAVYFAMLPGGTINVYNVGNNFWAGRQLKGTFTLPGGIDVWTRLDILIQFHQGSGTGAVGSILDVYANETLAFSYHGPKNPTSSTGIDNTQFNSGSTLGWQGQGAITDTKIEIDFDDWFSAAFPAGFTGVDWKYGSRILPLRATGDGPSRSGWNGDWRAALPYPGVTTGGTFDSTVPGATLDVVTDYHDQQQGCASIVAAIFCVGSNGAQSSVGPVVDGAAHLTTSNEPNNLTYAGGLYQVGGSPVPPPITEVRLQHIRSTSPTGTSTKGALIGSAELLGAWGPEDGPGTYPPFPGLQNAPYPYDFAPYTAGAYAIVTGSYVGNGSGQDILPGFALHWWFCRGINGAGTGGTGIAHWHSALLGAHEIGNSSVTSDLMCQALIEHGVPKIRVVGANPGCNQAGITYYWVGVHDPGGRFLRNGAFAHNTRSDNVPYVNKLWDPTFTPIAAFFTREFLNTNVGGHWYKGVGHTTDQGTQLTGGAPESLGTLGPGTITSGLTLHQDGVDVGYNVWRVDDTASTDHGVAVTSYTGDGTAPPRTIALVLQGRVPCFVYVVPHSSSTVSHYRDKGFTGTQSSSLNSSGSITPTAIVAVLADAIQVGTTLNATGVIYDVFALPTLDGPLTPVPSPGPPQPPPGPPVPPGGGGPGPGPGPGGSACSSALPMDTA